MRNLSLLVLMIFSALVVLGQEKRAFIGLSHNAVSLGNPLPAGPLHPGLDVGVARMLNDHPKIRWFQTYRIGVTYQGDAQTVVPLYSELGFRYIFPGGFALGPQLGLGYMHLFSGSPTVKRNDDGTYRKALNLGRPQMMGALTLGASYGTGPVRYFLNYQVTLQGPFVPGRAPILPTTSLRAGVSFPLKKAKKHE